MIKKVRTLLRVSSRQQLHDDDIPIQRAEAKEYIEKQQDWVFDKEYLEKAVSAYKNTVEDREVLQQILEDARNKEFDVLLAYMSDRIGRKEEYSLYVATLNDLGIEVWTIKDGQLKTEEHVDKLLNFIRFWQNEGESKKTSMRVKDARREMVKAGRFVGGKAPYGYELVLSGELSNHGRALHKLQIVPEQAENVKLMFDLYTNQGMGFERIAKELNHREIPAIGTDQWKFGTVASILKNPIYMGYITIGRRKNHPNFVRLDRKEWIFSEEVQQELVIIEIAQWEKAQEIRESRKTRMKSANQERKELWEAQGNIPFTTHGSLPLIGIAYCGYCHMRLTNGSYSYKWFNKKENREKVGFTGRYLCQHKCRERSGYSQSYLEGVVYSVVDGYIEKLKTIDIESELKNMQQAKKKTVAKELQTIDRELKTMENDIATLEENIPQAMRGEYLFSVERLAELMNGKEERRAELLQLRGKKHQELEELQISKEQMQQFIEVMPNWKEEFHKTDSSTKQMLLSQLIERIDVKDDEIHIKFKIRLEDFLHSKTIDSPTTPYRRD